MRQPSKLTALLMVTKTPQWIHDRLREEDLVRPDVTVELLKALMERSTEEYRSPWGAIPEEQRNNTLGGPEWDHILAGYLHPYLTSKGRDWASEAYEPPV